MNEKINRKKYREQLVKLMAASHPRYHLTLVFEAYSNEKATRQALDKFIIHLNKVVYKRRYQDGKSSLEGFVSRERGSLLKKNTEGLMHCDHYHIFLCDEGNYFQEKCGFRIKVERQVAYVNRIVEGTRIRGYLLQEYYNEGGDDLERYLTKGFNRKSLDDDIVTDSIGIIGSDRVEFGRSLFEVK